MWFFSNNYQFRYGIKDGGGSIPNDIKNPNLVITNHNEEYYNEFINELLHITKDWDEKYLSDRMDGWFWDINIRPLNKNYSYIMISISLSSYLSIHTLYFYFRIIMI